MRMSSRKAMPLLASSEMKSRPVFCAILRAWDIAPTIGILYLNVARNLYKPPSGHSPYVRHLRVQVGGQEAFEGDDALDFLSRARSGWDVLRQGRLSRPSPPEHHRLV